MHALQCYIVKIRNIPDQIVNGLQCKFSLQNGIRIFTISTLSHYRVTHWFIRNL